MIRWIRVAPVALVALVSTWASAQTPDAVLSRVRQEQRAYLDTLRDLVSIESGSSDLDGLATIAELIAGRLRALGGGVEFVEPPANMVRFENTPPRTGKALVARF